MTTIECCSLLRVTVWKQICLDVTNGREQVEFKVSAAAAHRQKAPLPSLGMEKRKTGTKRDFAYAGQKEEARAGCCPLGTFSLYTALRRETQLFLVFDKLCASSVVYTSSELQGLSCLGVGSSI